ncbi:MAG: tetraacyldisaccharide 4'-kinase [Vicinamibacterales bacterium]
MLSALYAVVARRRRARYARRPDLRRRLRRPVISVGNLAVGGRGKTPVVAALVRVLTAAGERPAILSRGYGRTEPSDGVVVVSAPDGIRADLARAGDEPLMLARQLPGVPVLVASDRYLAGQLAEHHFDVTVHVLDDGFQHLQLDRDLDLVIVSADDLAPSARTLPFGRLREAPAALLAADAILSADASLQMPDADERPRFTLRRELGPLRGEGADAIGPDTPLLAVCGIANPTRFVTDLRERGWNAVQSLTFRDHHPYRQSEVTRIVTAARTCGARAVVTTEKDFVRLLPYRPFPLPVVYLPLTMEIEPAAEFRDWLDASLRAAREITGD